MKLGAAVVLVRVEMWVYCGYHRFLWESWISDADVSVFLQAHEDPMYDLIRENKRNEKETRYDSEFDFKGCGRLFFNPEVKNLPLFAICAI